MPLRLLCFLGLGLVALPSSATGQTTASPADSTVGAVRTVLRAFYLNYQTQNWDALASYVLSPKLMERRGVPADSQVVVRDRTRSRTLDHAVSPPAHCPSPTSAMVEEASIRIDGDWADVSVPRCQGSRGGVDEFRLMFFEQRWRFIYTELF